MQNDPTGVKSALLANMSHEFRTPLNGIIGFAEMLADELMGPIEAEQKEALEHILVSARHLLGMIDDVLQLSDVTSGRTALQPQPVVLSQLCGDVCQAFGALAVQKRVSLEVSIDPEVEHVILDPERLKQLLQSLISNALKFTPEGGQVSVSAVRENGGELRLQVRDTGIGIESKDLHRLFVAFGQLDHGVGKQFPGLGLGLALAKRLVEEQGGRIGVESRPSEGSTFFAVLPNRPHGAGDSLTCGVYRTGAAEAS